MVLGSGCDFLQGKHARTIVRLSKAERLLLGHHVQPSVKSMLTYSREDYTSLAGKVLALYRTIRSGAFDPDLDPA